MRGEIPSLLLYSTDYAELPWYNVWAITQECESVLLIPQEEGTLGAILEVGYHNT